MMSAQKLIDQRKQAELQRLQNPNQINGDNLQNLRCETNRTYGKHKREYLKGKVISLKVIIKTKILETCTEA
jgi:hypothetical protein